jgi:rubrerythrin
MTMETASAAVKALRQALKLEQAGQRFYRQAAARTVDPKGAAMFASLVEDEAMHERIIQRQIDSLAQGEGWTIPSGVGQVQADLDAPLFPKGQVDLEKAVRPDASDLEALLFALKIENDSFTLYVEQAKAAQDASARRMYEYLVDAERTHFNLLMLNYESLNTMGGWAD